MSNTQYNLQFEKLCTMLKLGRIICTPKEIAGGLLHRMYAVDTTLGKYAIKALNPEIMLRPFVMQRYNDSERIANKAAGIIPALPAKSINGSSIHEVDKQFYLVFDWIDGRSLKSNEINIVHCEKMGNILAQIHMMDFGELGIINDCSDTDKLTDWNYYLQKGKAHNSTWVNQLYEIIDKLYGWNEQSNKSEKQLASQMGISHRDLDSKNVMWNHNEPIIIDWESAGYINPMKEMIETAVYWSEKEMGIIDKERFLAFINGYKKSCRTLKADWRAVLVNGFASKLGWLEYNLKRSLWIECTDEKEQHMGNVQVMETINAISHYADRIPELEKWLNSEVW